MNEFVKFPHTPHLAWLADGSPRADKVLSVMEAAAMLKGSVVVEEKVDGANIGISVDSDGLLRVQQRGDYLTAPFDGQFGRLSSWIQPRSASLIEALSDSLILFGEWCAARHSLEYRELPDWMLAFDIYDRRAKQFWSSGRRDALLRSLQIAGVPQIHTGPVTFSGLKEMLARERSRLGEGQPEGFIIRREGDEWLSSRAKLVHPHFTQAIDAHWSRQGIRWNRLSNLAQTQFSSETPG